MESTELLVEKSMHGDGDAFTELVVRYQNMAFAYALSTIGDYQLAEDATQRALITAYRSLPSLRDPARFGGWLRGIVRFECLRVVRDRARHRSDQLDGVDLEDRSTNVEAQVELRTEVEALICHMSRLPECQRIVAQLYYLGDQTQAAVADFLCLSVSTVNNRLREARAELRREGAYAVNNKTPRTPSFEKRIGEVIRSSRHTVDVQLSNETRPTLLTSVSIDDPGRAISAFVSQYVGDDVARLVVLDDATSSFQPEEGTAVSSDGGATTATIDSNVVEQLVNQNRIATSSSTIATGIKIIDLFSPVVTGGVVALVGEKNVGKLVLVEELAHRLASTGNQLTVLVFLKSPDEPGAVHKLDLKLETPVTTVVIPVVDASVEALFPSLAQVDSVIVFSGEMGKQGFYPAINPVSSRSFGNVESRNVSRARELLKASPMSDRGELLRAYLTQPFYVAEPYSGRPGVSVPQELAERDLAIILDSDVSAREPEELMMSGNLDA